MARMFDTKFCYVTQPNAIITLVANANSSTCSSNNGYADISIAGGTGAYTYTWSTDKRITSISNLIAANYSLTVTDANNCSYTHTL